MVLRRFPRFAVLGIWASCAAAGCAAEDDHGTDAAAGATSDAGRPASVNGGARASAGGGGANGGKGGASAGGASGDLSYTRACSGDTAMCGDPEVLRCLGIRDDERIYGYACSNSCATVDDCTRASSDAEASVRCVDFVNEKHCLLVCLDESRSFDCPKGMGCSVYPGATIGYCLWP